MKRRMERQDLGKARRNWSDGSSSESCSDSIRYRLQRQQCVVHAGALGRMWGICRCRAAPLPAGVSQRRKQSEFLGSPRLHFTHVTHVSDLWL